MHEKNTFYASKQSYQIVNLYPSVVRLEMTILRTPSMMNVKTSTS